MKGWSGSFALNGTTPYAMRNAARRGARHPTSPRQPPTLKTGRSGCPQAYPARRRRGRSPAGNCPAANSAAYRSNRTAWRSSSVPIRRRPYKHSGCSGFRASIDASVIDAAHQSADR